MADIGNLYVIAAPSGTGKTTLVDAVVKTMKNIVISISHTTRPKRSLEQHGVNYYFIEKKEFEDMLSRGEFLEHATVFDHLYGTSKKWVEDTLAKGIDVILEIDWQGHQQIVDLYPQSIGIFILPPSKENLRNRLVNRQQDELNIINQRLADAALTISHIKEFDYVIINDEFDQAAHDLKIIIEAGRLIRDRQLAKHAKMIANFAI